MSRWPKEIADAVFFDIRFGLKFKVDSRSRPATDQEIDLVARHHRGASAASKLGH
jgi:hypothetical protein